MRTKTWPVIVVLLLGLLVPMLSGCTPEDRELAWDIFMEWSAGRTGKALSGSTGEAEADAALDAAKPLRDIKKADDHVKKAKEHKASIVTADVISKGGGQKEAQKAVDEVKAAVQLRPNDWTYRLEAATLMLSVNHQEWDEQFDQAEALLDQNPTQTQIKQFSDMAIGRLEALRSEWADPKFSWEEPYQCKVLHQRLARYYNLRWERCGGSADDWKKYIQYKDDAEACQS